MGLWLAGLDISCGSWPWPSIVKGLYHWAVICGINAPFPSGFDSYSPPYQVATVFFAVIDPVAGSGPVARGSMGRRGVAHVGHFDGRGRGVLSANLWWEHMGRRDRARPARHLCVAGRDGCARTAGVTQLRSTMGEKRQWRESAFIGLGNMGLPMAQKSGQGRARVVRLRSQRIRRRTARRRRTRANSIADACRGAEVVITMLPAGQQVRDGLSGPSGIDRAGRAGNAADRLLDHRCRDRAGVAQAAADGIRHARRPGFRRGRGRAGGDATFMVGGAAMPSRVRVPSSRRWARRWSMPAGLETDRRRRSATT